MGEKQIKSDTNRMTKTIGKTTYIVNMHFKDKGENFSQKLKRVLRADAVKSISWAAFQSMHKEKYKILLISSNRKNWFVDVSVMQEAEEIDPKISADSLRVSPIEYLIIFQFEMES